MPWDDEKAAEATEHFHAFLTQLEQEYPDAVRRLRERWKQDYLVSGHKRHGRIVLGYTPEQASRQRG